MSKYTLHIVLMFVGITLVAGAQVSALGTFLYQWGALENSIGSSAWFAFKVWLSMLAIGLPVLFFALSL